METIILSYIGLIIAGALIQYLIISYATRSDRQVRNQQAIIWFLIKLCEKQGVPPEEIEQLRNHFQIK